MEYAVDRLRRSSATHETAPTPATAEIRSPGPELATLKVPKRYEFLAELPPTGSLDKGDLLTVLTVQTDRGAAPIDAARVVAVALRRDSRRWSKLGGEPMAEVTDQRESGSPTSRAPRVYLPLLLLVVFAVYAPSLGNGFALDDPYIAKASRPNGEPNSMTSELRPVSDYFRAGYWEGNKGTPSRLFRPVTILSYAVTNELQGGLDANLAWEAFPHHMINVLLHVWAVFLAFRLISRLTRGFWPALLGATVFGLNAIHSEVVAGIVGRAELFGFCFGAQGLLLVFAGMNRSGVARIGRLVGSTALLFLAFCAKEGALAWFPFIAVFAIGIDFRNSRRPDLARILVALAVALLPLVAFLVLQQAAVGGVHYEVHYIANPLYQADTTTRVLTAVMLWGYGLFKCLLPLNLVCDYGPVTFDMVESAGDPRFLFALVVLAAWLVAGLVSARRHPLFFVAMSCFLGFSFATSNIAIAIGTIFGERLYFTPSLGIGILVAWIASLTQRNWLLLPLGAWLVWCIVLIVPRNGAWDSDTELFSRDAATNPRCINLLNQKARQLDSAGKSTEAERLWRQAIDLDPRIPGVLANYASHLGTTRRFAAAEELFLRAIALADSRQPRRHVVRRDLSVLYELTHRQDENVEQLRLAWQEDSAYEEVWDPLVERTMIHLSTDEVEQIAATGERRAPGHSTWEFLRAFVAYQRGDFEKAAHGFRRALELRPRHARTRIELARSLIEQGRRSEAESILHELADEQRVPAHFREWARRVAR